MKGYFLERYKRFLVDIETEAGRTITAYCPATGRMTSCLEPGATCEYLPVDDGDRKLDYDWWSIKMPASWVIIDTRPANHWLYWHRTAPWLPDGWNRADWIPEPTLPNGGRLDYRLQWPDRSDTWVEIKSVTWCEDGTGYFPDAPSERGRRHLRELMDRTESGQNACVVFISMRSDIEEIYPARSIDPEFADLLEEAAGSGVSLIGLEAVVDDRSLHFTGTLPVKLSRARP